MDSVSEVIRVSERVMVMSVITGKTVLVSVCASQVRRSMDEEEFYCSLGKTLSCLSDTETVIVCGDFNGHVRET